MEKFQFTNSNFQTSPKIQFSNGRLRIHFVFFVFWNLFGACELKFGAYQLEATE